MFNNHLISVCFCIITYPTPYKFLHNIGYYHLVGYGKIPKSRLVQKLKVGQEYL